METKPPPSRRKRKQVLPEEITGILFSLSAYAGTKNVSYYLEVPASGFAPNAPLSEKERVRVLGYNHRYQRWYEITQQENVLPSRLANGEYRYRNSGYRHVWLYTQLGSKKFYVHRLVALICCPNDDPEHKNVVDHRDNNRQNNLPSNLEWVTPECNQQRLRQSRGWKPYSDKKREQARRQFARCSRAHWIRKQRLQESDCFSSR